VRDQEAEGRMHIFDTTGILSNNNIELE